MTVEADGSTKFTLLVEAAGGRIDSFVAGALPELSRTAVQRLVDAGEVTVNARAPFVITGAEPGDTVIVHYSPRSP